MTLWEGRGQERGPKGRWKMDGEQWHMGKKSGKDQPWSDRCKGEEARGRGQEQDPRSAFGSVAFCSGTSPSVIRSLQPRPGRNLPLLEPQAYSRGSGREEGREVQVAPTRVTLRVS
jgi:hypothetical protein